MRLMLCTFAIAVMATGICIGQDEADQRNAANEAATPRTFTVQITEVRMSTAPAPDASVEDIVDRLTQPEEEAVEMVETIRLSAMEQLESSAQFGSRVTVATGELPAGAGRPPMRRTQNVEIGTAVQVLVSPQGDKVRLTMSYEASRIAGERTDDDPPEISTVQIKTTLLLEPGKPMLVGGRSSEAGSFLLVSVAE